MPYQAMFEWIDMHVIYMRRVITFIADGVFPKTPLPNTTFTFARPYRRQSLGSGQRLRKRNLNRFPSCRIIVIAGRQSPNAMRVIRQYHPSVNVKWMARTNLPHRFAKGIDMLNQQTLTAIQ